MAGIKIEQPGEERLKKLGVRNWPVWDKEVSKFDWYYDAEETCFFLEGKVVVTAKDGRSVRIGKGDLVTFPRGLACVWDIQEAVRKHYNFG